MISTSPAEHATDPTLAALVPRRSPVRTGFLLLAAIALLVGIGWTGVTGRPGLDSSASSSRAIPGGQVLTIAWVVPRGLPSITLSSVTPVPGTTVVGAWAFEPSDPLYIGQDSTSTGDELAQELTPRSHPESALPHRVRSGEEVALVVLVDVVDCGALPPDATAVVTSDLPATVLRTWWGSTLTVPTPHLWQWDRESLTEVGGCPAQ